MESEKGKGSTFTVRLPVAGPPEAQAADEEDGTKKEEHLIDAA